MHQPPNTLARVRRVLDELVRPSVLGPGVPFDVEATAERPDAIGFVAAQAEPRSPFVVGSPWGRAWNTRWFRLRGTVPTGWVSGSVVAHIDLGFNAAQPGFQAEGLVWRDGRVLHAVQPDRRLVHLDDLGPGDRVELWVEAVAYPWVFEHGFRPTTVGDQRTAAVEPRYRLVTAELAEHRPEVDELVLELGTVVDLVGTLGADHPMRSQALSALDAAVLAVRPDDPVGSAPAARAALAPLLARPAAPGAHRIVATGHAHLDTAWLWPVSETRRKAVRTFANALDLLDRHPDHRVVVSQAQHYAWVAEDAPELFERVKAQVAAGRWEPAGGMWVETDLNLPAGESLLRQFLHGQRAFERWFGRRCPGAFLPDDFGYPGSFPQLVRHGGCSWFFTQKLSWNDTNRVPHHTFWWEGIDGSRVLAHMSPVETYNSTLEPHELAHAVRTFTDHAVSASSLACFGHGDGGGGATDEMIRRSRLVADWEPVPRVALGTVAGFFADVEQADGDRLATWVGELYFELHRGTASSQVATKQGNRACERLLHELELWSVARGRPLVDELDELWQAVLVQQFHDILPGSSIAWVHREAVEAFAAVAAAAEGRVCELVGAPGGPVLLNPAPVPVCGVVDAGGGPVWVELPAFGGGAPSPRPDRVAPVRVDGRSFDNGLVRLAWDEAGHVVSLVLLPSERDVVPPGRRANVLRVLRDRPGMWDAWDVDLADAATDGEELTAAVSVAVVDASPLRATLRVERVVGASRVVQTLTVSAGSARVDGAVEVDWHEDGRRLQLVWPVDVRAAEATCGTQFGHVRRPRHANTSWDAARFEVCAHRYVHAAEHGFGVALLADGPHGHDVRGDALRMTIVRAPSFPDPTADRGRHRVEYAVWAHVGEAFAAGLEDEAHRIAHPVRGAATAPLQPVVVVDAPGVLASAVKHAADGSGDVVVRVWESRGGRAWGTLRLAGGVTNAWRSDALEGAGEVLAVVDGAVPVALAPFEVATFRLRRGK